jgi:hypothetical protein
MRRYSTIADYNSTGVCWVGLDIVKDGDNIAAFSCFGRLTDKESLEAVREAIEIDPELLEGFDSFPVPFDVWVEVETAENEVNDIYILNSEGKRESIYSQLPDDAEDAVIFNMQDDYADNYDLDLCWADIMEC